MAWHIAAALSFLLWLAVHAAWLFAVWVSWAMREPRRLASGGTGSSVGVPS
jgi:hypothetical protein